MQQQLIIIAKCQAFCSSFRTCVLSYKHTCKPAYGKPGTGRATLAAKMGSDAPVDVATVGSASGGLPIHMHTNVIQCMRHLIQSLGQRALCLAHAYIRTSLWQQCTKCFPGQPCVALYAQQSLCIMHRLVLLVQPSTTALA